MDSSKNIISSPDDNAVVAQVPRMPNASDITSPSVSCAASTSECVLPSVSRATSTSEFVLPSVSRAASTSECVSPGFFRRSISQRLSTLCARTKYPSRQENGQRYFGPPETWKDAVPENAEIFISKLPADCLEDEIYDFCAQVGTVYTIRMMVTYNGTTRGFCYVTFRDESEAKRAIETLSGRPIRPPNRFVALEMSGNYCTLEMTGIDKTFTQIQIAQAINLRVSNLKGLNLKRQSPDGFWEALLAFESHKEAAYGRRKLNKDLQQSWGQHAQLMLTNKKEIPKRTKQIKNVQTLKMTAMYASPSSGYSTGEPSSPHAQQRKIIGYLGHPPPHPKLVTCCIGHPPMPRPITRATNTLATSRAHQLVNLLKEVLFSGSNPDIYESASLEDLEKLEELLQGDELFSDEQFTAFFMDHKMYYD